MNVWIVFVAASITAVFTGLGALPFLFIKNIDKKWLGLANALAAGLMLGASLGLLIEGYEYGIGRLLLGVGLGIVLVVVARRLLEGREEVDLAAVGQANALKMLLIIGVMTAHSFAEGIGVGVAYGDGQSFGSLITAAIAFHNIPEGLAISLVMIPRGKSVWQAAGWSIFSSLPQPLMAVPAFLFVLVFRPFLPVGLGLAAGAMIWMVFAELLPEASEHAPRWSMAGLTGLAVVAMLGFQFLLGSSGL
ncbi:MAG: ZIP family metal transporter [Chloroflexota bacterium]